MLSNKKTIVALIAASLCALNDATKLDQCCGTSAGDCDEASEETERAIVGLTSDVADEIASLAADLIALKNEFDQYKMQVQDDFVAYAQKAEDTVTELRSTTVDNINGLSERQTALESSYEGAELAFNDLETKITKEVEEITQTSHRNTVDINALSEDMNGSVAQLLATHTSEITRIDSERDEYGEAVEGLIDAVTVLNSQQITNDVYFANDENISCIPSNVWDGYWTWTMKTIYEFDVEAGESLDLHAIVSTDPAADTNKFFALWIKQDGNTKAASYDDSWTWETAEGSTAQDNGGIAIAYKTTVQERSHFEVQVYGGAESCLITWHQAQVMYKTYGSGHVKVQEYYQ